MDIQYSHETINGSHLLDNCVIILLFEFECTTLSLNLSVFI